MQMIIDCHTHIGLPTFLASPIPPEKLSRPAFQDRMDNTYETMLSQMDAHAVQKAVVFGFPLEEIDDVQANNYVLEAYRTYPERIIPFALISDDVDHWLKQGAQGFKQHDILYTPQRFDLPKAYKTIADAGVPVLIHFRAGEGQSVTEKAKSILRDAPHLKLIVAHMGRHTPNTGHNVEKALRGLQDFPNVFFETSTVRDPATIELGVSLVGDERILFGSDYPFNSFQDADPLAIEINVIDQANLSPEAKANILGLNAQRLLA